MVAGFLGCLLWTFTLQRSFARHGIDSVEVGVALSAVTFILVSRLTKPTPARNLRIFFDDVPLDSEVRGVARGTPADEPAGR
jgi:hypothetical protein